jgi:hypothetical protein
MNLHRAILGCEWLFVEVSGLSWPDLPLLARLQFKHAASGLFPAGRELRAKTSVARFRNNTRKKPAPP